MDRQRLQRISKTKSTDKKTTTMKKFKNGEDVVLTMTERELRKMKMLVTSGIIRYMGEEFWSENQIEEFNKLRDQMCDNYE